MWTEAKDGSVVDDTGKVIFFSTERFVRDICLGECCFICGASPTDKVFNNEHIVPEWLLRRCDLFEQTITLPNDVTVRYDRYTIPCCAECNSLMGDLIEKPMSEALARGPDGIASFLSEGNELKVFVWLALIYLKMHLKDQTLRLHLDARKGDQKIADHYQWEHLHHIHAVARCFYNGCAIDSAVLGSCLSIAVKSPHAESRFDYADLYLAQTVLLRVNNVALIAVFDDSGGAMGYFHERLKKITGPVSELQAREIMVELAYLNLHIKHRPIFRSDLDLETEAYRIVTHRPKLELTDMDRSVRGKLFYRSIKNVLPSLQFARVSQQEALQSIQAGDFTFLFDENGKFIENSWVIMES